MPSLFDPADQKLKAARIDSIKQLETRNSTFIDDLLALPEGIRSDIEQYYQGHLNSLVLTPILVENQLAALIACSNPKLPKKEIESNIRSLDVIAGMLGALMQREAVLNLLETRVADRTRELSAFFEMAMLAGEAVEISDVLQPALLKIIEISTSDAAFIHLYDEDEGGMVLTAQLGISKEQLEIEAVRQVAALKVAFRKPSGALPGCRDPGSGPRILASQERKRCPRRSRPSRA